MARNTRRAAIIVLDGVGCGAAPDAAAYGDLGSNTIGNVARAVGGLRLPVLERLGLGRIADIAGVRAVERPAGAWGRMSPASSGKDSTTGHWELAGVHLSQAFPTYAEGFPAEIVARFAEHTGRGVLGNVVGSGTDVINRYGDEHARTGDWILYTSADSVFQVATHESVVPLEELYAACEWAIGLEVNGAPMVSRAIARPFSGESGSYERTGNRRDFSVNPPSDTLLDCLEREGIPRSGVGKVDDLFAGRGIVSHHTSSNAEGIARIQAWLAGPESGLLFANLVDFDQLYGHRNDVRGFERALREFDAALPAMLDALREEDLLIITADHGNDPTTPSTDHAREAVPLIVAGPGVAPADLGVRDTFSDVGASVAEWLGAGYEGRGRSFIASITAK